MMTLAQRFNVGTPAVVHHPANLDRRHAILSGDAAQVRPESLLELGRD